MHVAWDPPHLNLVARYAPVPLAGDATALAGRTKKNSWYAVDTPKDLHLRCVFAKHAQWSRRGAPGIHHVRYVRHQILNMLKKNRRVIAEHKLRCRYAGNT